MAPNDDLTGPVTPLVHLTLAERTELGKRARARVPRGLLADYTPPADRPDPVELTSAQDGSRVPELVPIRYRRMLQNPFTFYRGSAEIMASDLRDSPTTGLRVQLCGDAHLSNFGVYASRERKLVFDVNDFDETLPGPWEWDVKRLVTSVEIMGRNNGFSAGQRRSACLATATAYRDWMAEYAQMPNLAVWYELIVVDDALEGLAKASDVQRSQVLKTREALTRARTKDSLQALGKLTEVVDDRLRIKDDPPLLVRTATLARGSMDEQQTHDFVANVLRQYRRSLPTDARTLLESYQLVDTARKVVGVGSVGTRCLIVLLKGRDDHDPFFLQIKEADRSVLEDHLPASTYTEHGRRVVEGQRLMQAASDSFLGWTVAPDGTHYYWRQFKDMKGSVEIDGAPLDRLRRYASLCGWTLARAHARSGDAAALAGYLGTGTVFDRAIAEFSVAYADQNERDYQAFTAAVGDGRLPAHQ